MKGRGEVCNRTVKYFEGSYYECVQRRFEGKSIGLHCTGHPKREAQEFLKSICVAYFVGGSFVMIQKFGRNAATPRAPNKLYLEPLKGYVAKHPDSTQKEIAKHFGCCVAAG